MTGVRLVRMTRKHVAALRDSFASGSASATTLYRFPQSLPAAQDMHARRMQGPARQFAILADGRFVGTAGLWPARFAGTELTIAIFDPAYRGKGVGSFVVRRLCDIAFRRGRLRRVELGVYPDNAPAIRVYERCGFVQEALLRKFIYHDGRWRDLLWMSLLRSDWRARR